MDASSGDYCEKNVYVHWTNWLASFDVLCYDDSGTKPNSLIKKKKKTRITLLHTDRDWSLRREKFLEKKLTQYKDLVSKCSKKRAHSFQKQNKWHQLSESLKQWSIFKTQTIAQKKLCLSVVRNYFLLSSYLICLFDCLYLYELLLFF